MPSKPIIRGIISVVVVIVIVLLSQYSNSTNMFNIFKKADSQRLALGLDVFSESEYGNFIKLVKSDMTSRGFEVGDVKDGYLTAKLNGKETSFGLVNLAQNCKLVKQAEWPAVIKDHFDALEKSNADEADIQKNITDFSKIKDLLAIQLYPDDYLNAAGDLKKEVITRSSIPTVNSTLVLDLPSSIRPLKNSEVKAWNKSEDEVFALALNNTFNKIKPEIIEQEMPGGKMTFITSDNFLTAVLVLNLKKFNRCMGAHGSLVAIPTRGVIMCYPINDLNVVKAISSFAPFVTKLHSEGPGSLSSKLYWYQGDTFTDLPYKIEDGKLNFAPPQNFVDMLNTLK